MDIKSKIQGRADEIADQRYGKDFYDLPATIQIKIFNEAEIYVFESLQESADAMRKESEILKLLGVK